MRYRSHITDGILAKREEIFNSSEFKEETDEEDPKMTPLIPYFIKLNKLGYITSESQNGHVTHVRKSVRTSSPSTIIERAFISGYMEEELAAHFLRVFNIESNGKIAMYLPIVPNSTYLPSHLDVPLTITKHGKQALSDSEIETHMSSAIPKEADTIFQRNQLGIKTLIDRSRKRYVIIECVDTIWRRNGIETRDGLFKEVLRVLMKIQRR